MYTLKIDLTFFSFCVIAMCLLLYDNNWSMHQKFLICVLAVFNITWAYYLFKFWPKPMPTFPMKYADKLFKITTTFFVGLPTIAIILTALLIFIKPELQYDVFIIAVVASLMATLRCFVPMLYSTIFHQYNHNDSLVES